MARNRRQSFIEGFMEGYNAVGQIAKDFELSKVANANFEESQGYTQDQGDQLRAAAESGQYDIGIKTKEDGTFDSYTVTPKADPSQTGTIAMQGVTDFLGERTAGRMNQDQRDRARQMAMAGVLEKYDPQEGMRLRREIKSQERDDQRWDRQTKQWEREDKKLAEEDEYQRGYKDLYANTRYSQNQARHQQEMAKYQQNLAQYEADKAAGKQVGAAPVMPSAPEYSVGDRLADRATLLDYKARAGKVDPREFGEFTDLLDKVQGEGYERAMRLAQSGAPIQEVAKAFNATGQTKFDQASVVSDKVVKGKDGVETRVIQYRDGQGNVRTINALAELDALGKAGEVFTRHFQVKQDKRADEQLQISKNADARAGAQFAQAQADRKTEKTKKEADRLVLYNLWKDQNPNATPAQDAAAQRNFLKPRTEDGREITSEFKTDQMGGGYVTQRDKAGNVVITPVSRTGEQGKPIVIAPPGQSSAPAMTFASVAEGEAAAKAGKIKPGDRVTIGGRTAVWMPDAAAPAAPAAKAPPPARASVPVQQAAPRPQAAPQSATQAPPPAQSAPRSVASLLGADSNTPIGVIMANKAQAIEAAASELKTAQSQFAAAARSGDQAAMADYQRRLASAQQRLNAVLGTMNEAQATQVRRALGVF